MNIAIYSLSYCDICLRLKDNLQEEGIEFHSYLVDEDDSLANQIENKVGTNSYPIVKIENNSKIMYITLGNSQEITDISETEHIAHYETLAHLTYTLKKLYEE